MFECQDLIRTWSRSHSSDRMEASGSIGFCLSAVDSVYSPRLNFEEELWMYSFHVIAGVHLLDRYSRPTPTTAVARSLTEEFFIFVLTTLFIRLKHRLLFHRL